MSKQRIDEELSEIMADIHRRCVEHGRESDGETINYRKGANVAGFLKLAGAMLAQSTL